MYLPRIADVTAFASVALRVSLALVWVDKMLRNVVIQKSAPSRHDEVGKTTNSPPWFRLSWERERDRQTAVTETLFPPSDVVSYGVVMVFLVILTDDRFIHRLESWLFWTRIYADNVPDLLDFLLQHLNNCRFDHPCTFSWSLIYIVKTWFIQQPPIVDFEEISVKIFNGYCSGVLWVHDCLYRFVGWLIYFSW